MKNLGVAFLWHMHQPCYFDGLTGKITLPWIRLHGIKAYYDMPLVLEEFENTRATINVVPSLIEQINHYKKRESFDIFYDYTFKRASELTNDDKIFILRYFFSCNWPTMINPFKDYNALLIKRGTSTDPESLQKKLKRFTTQDFLDLQCWFNLAWFGFKAIENKPGIKELFNKSKKFSEADKKFILDTQLEILDELPSIYKRVQDSGHLEISMSPYYHPILPVIIDSDSARRAMPYAVLPSRMSYPEDADSHIKMGVELYQTTFGRDPKGMWPSEGSVSPEACELIRKSGIKWIATDQEVLAESIRGITNVDELLKPHTVYTSNGELDIFFRDKAISNLISFTYQRQSSDLSVSNLIHTLDKIRQNSKLENPCISVILDGENPWEYYQDRGSSFLRGMYKEISRHPNIQTRTFSDVSESVKQKGKITNLHTGSWINHNFDVWIGKPNTNKAWELVKKTREALVSTLEKKNFPEEISKNAWQELYRAEGSDWFWWYSDYFYTDNAEEFDRLFRTHLMKVYRLIEIGIPWQLQVPVFTSTHPMMQPSTPKGLMSPVIDGKLTSFYEWANAGVLEIDQMGALIQEGRHYLDAIHYGFDLENLYIRIDPDVELSKEELNNLNFYISIINTKFYRLKFRIAQDTKTFTLLESTDRMNFSPCGEFSAISVDKLVELSLPFSAIHTKPGDIIKVAVNVSGKDLELARYPRSGYLSLEVPDKDYEQIMWMV